MDQQLVDFRQGVEGRRLDLQKPVMQPCDLVDLTGPSEVDLIEQVLGGLCQQLHIFLGAHSVASAAARQPPSLGHVSPGHDLSAAGHHVPLLPQRPEEPNLITLGGTTGAPAGVFKRLHGLRRLLFGGPKNLCQPPSCFHHGRRRLEPHAGRGPALRRFLDLHPAPSPRLFVDLDPATLISCELDPPRERVVFHIESRLPSLHMLFDLFVLISRDRMPIVSPPNEEAGALEGDGDAHRVGQGLRGCTIGNQRGAPVERPGHAALRTCGEELRTPEEIRALGSIVGVAYCGDHGVYQMDLWWRRRRGPSLGTMGSGRRASAWPGCAGAKMA
mmetsp:Transcript_110252/g.284857  ORF Transcript_110252/g.284857 Transcript_110252/m.284857 type:complete len:330 (+) Transcript_110252:203-1192(+)